MKITKRQLKSIIKETMSRHGTYPVASFSRGQGFLEMQDSAMEIFDDMLEGSIFLMDPVEYGNLLDFITDMADDGNEDFIDFKNALEANSQGQYVRIRLA